MDVLILGFSSIVQRRVLPALHALHAAGIDVATRKAADPAVRRGWGHGKIFEDYRSALSETNATVAYISLVNSEHERWAEQALEAGLHVIVDKPAFLGRGRAERLLALAERQQRCLAEATVFAYHAQVACIRKLFADSGSGPTRVSAMLSFPPLDASNFRYQRTLGGGALWDIGPYVAAAGRVFFGAEPETVAGQILRHAGSDGVEVAFSALCTYSGGRSLVGHFGFDTVYRNRVDLIGPALGVQADRLFTTPPDLANSLYVTRGDQASSVEAPCSDAFAEFLAHVFRCIDGGDWSALAADLHADARTLQRLRYAAGEQGQWPIGA